MRIAEGVVDRNGIRVIVRIGIRLIEWRRGWHRAARIDGVRGSDGGGCIRRHGGVWQLQCGRAAAGDRAVGRNLVAGHHQACGIDQKTILVLGELAVARVADLTAGAGHTKKAVAVGNTHIQWSGTALQRTLAEILRNGRDLGTKADARPRIHIGKNCGATLEADGARVGDIVADYVEITSGGIQPAYALRKTHCAPLFR